MSLSQWKDAWNYVNYQPLILWFKIISFRSKTDFFGIYRRIDYDKTGSSLTLGGFFVCCEIILIWKSTKCIFHFYLEIHKMYFPFLKSTKCVFHFYLEIHKMYFPFIFRNLPKSAKNRFQLSAGLNFEKLNTILCGTNHTQAAAQIL